MNFVSSRSDRKRTLDLGRQLTSEKPHDLPVPFNGNAFLGVSQRSQSGLGREAIDHDAGFRVANGRSPSPRCQLVPARQGGGLDSPEAVSPPAAQVDRVLKRLGPILAWGRGPDSSRTGRPPRGGLVASVIGVMGQIPRRGGQHRQIGRSLGAGSMPIPASRRRPGPPALDRVAGRRIPPPRSTSGLPGRTTEGAGNIAGRSRNASAYFGSLPAGRRILTIASRSRSIQGMTIPETSQNRVPSLTGIDTRGVHPRRAALIVASVSPRPRR